MEKLTLDMILFDRTVFGITLSRGEEECCKINEEDGNYGIYDGYVQRWTMQTHNIMFGLLGQVKKIIFNRILVSLLNKEAILFIYVNWKL